MTLTEGFSAVVAGCALLGLGLHALRYSKAQGAYEARLKRNEEDVRAVANDVKAAHAAPNELALLVAGLKVAVDGLQTAFERGHKDTQERLRSLEESVRREVR